MIEEKNTNLNFKNAAIYKIVVQGIIQESLSDRYRGMQISVERKKGKAIISTLIGEIRDQAALSGVLNTIYDSHLTVISVNMLSEIESE
jgi:hypothetical protein